MIGDIMKEVEYAKPGKYRNIHTNKWVKACQIGHFEHYEGNPHNWIIMGTGDIITNREFVKQYVRLPI